jgi:NAD(P)-dependent dehydrogenase (short-subunit alcohol dehydrogenase family)
VFTSNISAILGLRALYFTLAAAIHRFRYIQSSLVFLLAFIGVKMLLHHHFVIPAWVSLSVIGGILSVGVSEAARHLRGRGGRIVNVAARPALEPTGGLIAYAAAKAAVAAITRALAAELVNESILVNAIVPSVIDTASNRAAMPGADHERWPKPAELAAAIRFLVSPTNTTTSGVLLPCYGRA